MCGAPSLSGFAAISSKLTKLENALHKERSRRYCLGLWSEFIRARDANRCVDCHSTNGLSAHHIRRKSLVSQGQFLTGNGITLCRDCHKEAHKGFNGRPDLSMPVDAQGGEKLASMERLFSILVDDALERGLLREEFYFLSDELLGTLKKIQGFHPDTFFPGARIEQAYLILAECEPDLRRAVAESNGLLHPRVSLFPSGMHIVLLDDDRRTTKKTVRTYVPRSKSGR